MVKLILCFVLLSGLIEDANNAPEGSIISIPAGNYSGGTITNNITLTANGDAKFTSTLTLRGAVNINGFVFGNKNGQLIEVRASNCTINNCLFQNFGKSGSSKAIWIREHAQYDNTLIENNIFDNWANTSSHSSCIKVSQSGGAQHEGTIIRSNIMCYGADGGNSVAIQLFAPTLCEYNEIHNVEDAFEVKGNGSSILYNYLHHNTGSEQLSNRDGSNNIFDGNTVHNVTSWPAWIAEGDNITFVNNLIYNCPNRGMRITGTVPNRYSGTSNILVAHNTFVDVNNALEDDSRQTILPENLVIVNNIFVRGGWSLPRNMMSQADYNLYWEVEPSKLSANDIIVDPNFVDGSFSLSTSIPGTDVSVLTDHDEVLRDNTPDRGAFEHIALNQELIDSLILDLIELNELLNELEIWLERTKSSKRKALIEDFIILVNIAIMETTEELNKWLT